MLPEAIDLTTLAQFVVFTRLQFGPVSIALANASNETVIQVIVRLTRCKGACRERRLVGEGLGNSVM